MPTYDYKCENCGYIFEHFQSMKDEPLTKCPECGHDSLKRLISGGAGLVFKGTGFYLTDYKSSGKGSTESSSTGNAKKETKTEAKTEAKAETKTETKSDSAKST